MLWAPNTQLHYPFQNTALDYSGIARHGTVNGSGVYATRPNAGRCLYFDGVGDYVNTPSFGLSADHTAVVLACWIRCKHDAGLTQGILGENAISATVGFLFCYITGSSPYCLRWRYANGTGIEYTEAPDYFAGPFDDAWLHMTIACDYVGKKTYFYRGGIKFGSPIAMSGTPVFPSTARVKYIGSYNTTTFLLTAGYLADVQLWSLATMPPIGQMTANANRLMLGMNPIW